MTFRPWRTSCWRPSTARAPPSTRRPSTTNPSLSASEEGRHQPGSEELWSESWYFDFFAPDGSIGGWIRLGLYPNLGIAWYHALLVGAERRTIAVIDTEAPIPRNDRLELRAPGLWAEHGCETPLDHWVVTNEAHGVAVDSPEDLYDPEPRGELVPLAFDLEWETDGVPYHYEVTTRYEIPCRVHGEIAVGHEKIDLDGFGQRDHSWGVRDWWQFGWCWTAGRLDDGLRFHGSDIQIPGVDVGFGYVQPPEGDMSTTNSVSASDSHIDIGGFGLDIDPIALAPVLLVSKDGARVSRFPRALCRFTTPDGRQGLGWTEWNQPQP